MTIELNRKIGEILECRISGEEKKLLRVSGRYDYQNGDKSTCPICNGLGVPWGGLFHCENYKHVAVIETGECFEVLP